MEVERDKKRKRSKNELAGERGKKAREVRVAPSGARSQTPIQGYLFQLFSTVYDDIIELLNRRYNLVRSIFAPFFFFFFFCQLSLPLINGASSNAIVLRVNCHSLPLMVKTVCNSVTVKISLFETRESDRERERGIENVGRDRLSSVVVAKRRDETTTENEMQREREGKEGEKKGKRGEKKKSHLPLTEWLISW